MVRNVLQRKPENYPKPQDFKTSDSEIRDSEVIEIWDPKLMGYCLIGSFIAK